MSVRIRLQRHGKKGKPFYHVVVADSRSKRDGRIIERLGSYNPNTHPATIDIHFEKALAWLKNGANPSDTARALLSESGVLMRKHLDGGVAKGAFSKEEGQKRFDAWFEQKQKQNLNKLNKIAQDKESSKQERLAAEKKYREAKDAALEKIAEQESGANTPEETKEEV